MRIPVLALAVAFACLFALPAMAQTPDPVLHQKAQDYVDYLASRDFWGWGGVSEMQYTDETLTNLNYLRGTGDSCIWTGMYLGAQSLRYMATGDAQALDEVERIAPYTHTLLDITGVPGFVARYAAPDEDPWNRQYPDTHSHKVLGVGEYEGAFWVDHTSRDQYTGWFYGKTLAYDALPDGDLRDQQCEDLSAVIDALISNHWLIVDQYGEIWSASVILPSMRLSWIAQTAHVCGDDPEYWALFDEQYDKFAKYLWLDTISFPNKYSQYYGFNLGHINWYGLLRLTPDIQRLEYLYRIWDVNIRTWTKDTHNAWFDAIHLAGCVRADACDPGELEHVMGEISTSLHEFPDAPNQEYNLVCEELPLDPFSVFWEDLEELLPWLDDLWDVDPQTAEAHAMADRCWSDMFWQRSPYHVSCNESAELVRVGPGVDYMSAYWLAYYYGLVDGGGPYGDDDPTDDDTVDDDTTDDDTADDDTTDDDTVDDDDVIDDDVTDDDVTDDDVADDDATDDDATDDDDDDDNDDGCGG